MHDSPFHEEIPPGKGGIRIWIFCCFFFIFCFLSLAFSTQSKPQMVKSSFRVENKPLFPKAWEAAPQPPQGLLALLRTPTAPRQHLQSIILSGQPPAGGCFADLPVGPFRRLPIKKNKLKSELRSKPSELHLFAGKGAGWAGNAAHRLGWVPTSPSLGWGSHCDIGRCCCVTSPFIFLNFRNVILAQPLSQSGALLFGRA